LGLERQRRRARGGNRGADIARRRRTRAAAAVRNRARVTRDGRGQRQGARRSLRRIARPRYFGGGESVIQPANHARGGSGESGGTDSASDRPGDVRAPFIAIASSV